MKDRLLVEPMPVSVPLPHTVTLLMPVGITVGSGPVIIQVPLFTTLQVRVGPSPKPKPRPATALACRGAAGVATGRPPFDPLGEATQRLRYPLIA
jgi:hypothetical protein